MLNRVNSIFTLFVLATLLGCKGNKAALTQTNLQTEPPSFSSWIGVSPGSLIGKWNSDCTKILDQFVIQFFNDKRFKMTRKQYLNSTCSGNPKSTSVIDGSYKLENQDRLLILETARIQDRMVWYITLEGSGIVRVWRCTETSDCHEFEMKKK